MSDSTEKSEQNAEKQEDIAAFRKSYPIDFSLLDDNGNSVLYINDASGGHNLHLKIINTSESNIQLVKNEEKQCHLELRFRPNVLANYEKITLKESQDWEIKCKLEPDRDISLYLLYKKDKEVAIKTKEKIDLTLQEVSGSDSGGARGTQIELKYKIIQGGEDFLGNRLKSMSIVNHSGRKDIPLHVGFIGGNDILNDGSPNELHLRIANTTLKEVSFNLNVRPKFIISFDIGDANTNPWALGTKSQVANIKVEVKYPTLEPNKCTDKGISLAQNMPPKEEMKASEQNISPQWEINVSDGLQKLNPGQSFEIKLSDIRTTHPSGHTNLYLRYENIPGYWDGQFICSIEKSPIVYKNNSVGIGTIDPGTNKLKVQGSAEITGTLKADKIEGNGAFKIGMIIMWSGTKVPDGWVLCDGKTIDRHKVPDLRGRFVLGYGHDKKNNLSERKLNDTGGWEQVTLKKNEMPAHTHSGETNKDDGKHQHELWQHYQSFVGKHDDKEDHDRPLKANKESGKDFLTKDEQGKHTHNFTTSSAGGDEAHTNMPPFYVLAYIMYTGLIRKCEDELLSS